MAITRRTLIRDALAATGGALLAPSLFATGDGAAAAAADGRPRRVVFFLQNHGFDLRHSLPVGVAIETTTDIASITVSPEGTNVWQFNGSKHDRVQVVDLAAHRLPPHIDLLEPYKKRLTIVHGLNGQHVGTFHGSRYGALGGFRKQANPGGETIDCALGRALPAVLPLISVGLGGGSEGVATGISAWDRGRAVPMPQGPRMVYDALFAPAVSPQAKARYELETELYDFLRDDARGLLASLPPAERRKIAAFDDGLVGVADRRRRLAQMTGALARHAPDIGRILAQEPGERIASWEAHIANGIAALKAGVTNVLTFSAGMGDATEGSWSSIGVKTRGHALGHTDQAANPEWLTLRRYNIQLLIRIMQALEAEKEGSGTMMDNTLIVYTSCHAESHHSRGHCWPYLLLGDLGGRLRTGRYVQYPFNPPPNSKNTQTPHTKVRSINAFYATLLRAAGQNADWFNHMPHMREQEPPGPLPELMA